MIQRLLILALAAMSFVACQTTKDTGTSASKTTSSSSSSATKGAMKVDIANSKIEWTGVKPDGKHMGDLKLKSGEIQVKNGTITGGSFVIDMNSINTTDLEGKYKNMLDDHLKASDFFNVSKFGESTFTIKKVSASSKEGETHTIDGVLKLLGIDKDVSFGANVKLTDKELSATTPEFGLDRTNWGINTKSSKSEEGGVDDIIKLKITLKAGM